MKEYQDFLAKKIVLHKDCGFDVEVNELNPRLFGFQAAIDKWLLKVGKCGLFAGTGLGKTIMQLVYADWIIKKVGGKAIVLTPLGVANQTCREAEKFGIVVKKVACQDDCAGDGVFITNYQKLHLFDATSFVLVVLDEASILKSFSGKIKNRLVDAFVDTPYKLVCTATPAPNDHMEIGNYAEFLGVMPSNEMLSRWFINDTMACGKYRLKRHAEKDFWQWVASWAVCIEKPSDIGFSDEGFVLPELRMHDEVVEVDILKESGENLYREPDLSATGLHKELRLTSPDRARRVAGIVNDSKEAWVIWCHTDYEADDLRKLIPDAVEVRGSHKDAVKEDRMTGFTDGKYRVLISKPRIAGFGMNWQHCHNVAFVGLSYSFEMWFQAIRRCWRFGQKEPVNCHVVTASTEGALTATIARKQKDYTNMTHMMAEATSANSLINRKRRKLMDVENDVQRGANWEMRLGDCVQEVAKMDDDSIGFCIHSPPFCNLYIYSDSVADLGNSNDDKEFFDHYSFLVKELYRVTIPGRLCAVHCKDLPLYKGRDGEAGLKDFPGDIIRLFISHGWTYHSRVTIWKDPVIEMERTKNNGLLHKTLCRDSSQSRQGMADYMIVFRKFPQDGTLMSAVPVVKPHSRDKCFTRYVGSEEPVKISSFCTGGMPEAGKTMSDFAGNPIESNFGLEVWQRYASPVWFDIDQTNVLNYRRGKGGLDEKHICPLQIGLIERSLELWTIPGDLVLSPFAGIGSEGFCSINLGRKFVGVELKRSYYETACANIRRAEEAAAQTSLYDLMEEPA